MNMVSFWKSILHLARGLILPVIFGIFIMMKIAFHGPADFALWVVLYTTVYAVSFWLFGMNQSEKQLVLKPLQRLRTQK